MDGTPLRRITRVHHSNCTRSTIATAESRDKGKENTTEERMFTLQGALFESVNILLMSVAKIIGSNDILTQTEHRLKLMYVKL